MPTFAGRETNNRRTIRVMEGLTALHALYVRLENLRIINNPTNYHGEPIPLFLSQAEFNFFQKVREHEGEIRDYRNLNKRKNISRMDRETERKICSKCQERTPHFKRGLFWFWEAILALLTFPILHALLAILGIDSYLVTFSALGVLWIALHFCFTHWRCLLCGTRYSPEKAARIACQKNQEIRKTNHEKQKDRRNNPALKIKKSK